MKSKEEGTGHVKGQLKVREVMGLGGTESKRIHGEAKTWQPRVSCRRPQWLFSSSASQLRVEACETDQRETKSPSLSEALAAADVTHVHE